MLLGNVDWFRYLKFASKPLQWRFQGSSQSTCTGLVCHNVAHSHHIDGKCILTLKKNTKNDSPLRLFLTFEPSGYCSSISGWSQLQLARKHPVFVLSLPIRPTKTVPGSYPMSSCLDFTLESFVDFWNSLGIKYQMSCRASNFDSNLPVKSAAWPTSCNSLSPPNPPNKLCGV